MQFIKIFSVLAVTAFVCLSVQAEQRSDIMANYFSSCMQSNRQAYPNLDEVKRQAYCLCSSRNFTNYGGEGAILDKTLAALGLRNGYSSNADQRIEYASVRAQENCLNKIK
jgi:hypothetical protein